MPLISNNYYIDIEDVRYNSAERTVSCKVVKTDHDDLIKESYHRVWKGNDYLAEVDNCPISAVAKKIKEETPSLLWRYDYKEVKKRPKLCRKLKKGVKLKHFHDVNYKTEITQSLYPKRRFSHGELQEVIWYSDVSCTDPIVLVEIVYTRDGVGLAVSRTTKRYWYNEDGTLNDEMKETQKNYMINPLDTIKEGIKRRGNIVDGLQMPILGMMMATITGMTQPEIMQLGRDFLKEHKTSFESFRQESHKQIWVDIADATDTWLDNIIAANGTTIRQYILAELNI